MIERITLVCWPFLAAINLISCFRPFADNFIISVSACSSMRTRAYAQGRACALAK
jgi:hypothetical protein